MFFGNKILPGFSLNRRHAVIHSLPGNGAFWYRLR